MPSGGMLAGRRADAPESGRRRVGATFWYLCALNAQIWGAAPPAHVLEEMEMAARFEAVLNEDRRRRR